MQIVGNEEGKIIGIERDKKKMKQINNNSKMV
jgi:precorrin-6B methylase 2